MFDRCLFKPSLFDLFLFDLSLYGLLWTSTTANQPGWGDRRSLHTVPYTAPYIGAYPVLYTAPLFFWNRIHTVLKISFKSCFRLQFSW